MFRSKAIAVGSPTVGNGILSSVGGWLDFLKELKFKNKKAAVFGCYGWSGESTRILRDRLADAGFHVVEPEIRCNWNPERTIWKASDIARFSSANSFCLLSAFALFDQLLNSADPELSVPCQCHSVFRALQNFFFHVYVSNDCHHRALMASTIMSSMVSFKASVNQWSSVLSMYFCMFKPRVSQLCIHKSPRQHLWSERSKGKTAKGLM